ncbi:MAG: hypothetical protein EZS28_045140, partial [Streblomastix strix]
MNRILAEVRKDMEFAINQLLGRYSPVTSELDDLETTNNLDSVLRLDLEFSNNGTNYTERLKISQLGFTEEVSKNNFGQSYDSSQLSGSDNWNFKFSQNTVQGGFPLSDAPIFSTNMSSERTRMVWDDEITDASTARDVLVDQQDIRKQETFFDMEHSSRDSSYGCSP